jgi:hypothetical protein
MTAMLFERGQESASIDASVTQVSDAIFQHKQLISNAETRFSY